MKKIFIVEDDAVVVQIYRRKLLSEGFHVDVAEDGLAAMKSLPAAKPDLVLLDLMMPKFNGADVLKFIRANKDLKNTKVVIFSNAYMTDLAQEAAKAGADKSLLKSACTPAQLIAVIKGLLGGTAGGGESPSPLAAAATITSEAATTFTAKTTPPIKSAEGEGTRFMANAPRSADTSTIFNEAKAKQDFLAGASATLASLHDLHEAFAKSPDAHSQSQKLVDLHRKIHYLTGVAGASGCHQIAHLASALEAMLFELQERPKFINDSSLQTIRATVEFFGPLFDRAMQGESKPLATANVLAVDDDAITTRALINAMNRAHLRCTSADNGVTALELLQEKHYDLLLLDYMMPGMDGLELFTKLRALPGYEKTPVVFVTGQADFTERAQSIAGRGADVILKPIFPIELAVKAVTLLLKNQPA